MRVKCARQTGQSTPRGCTLCGRTRCTAPRTLCGTTRRGVHPSPICRRQVACARPCLVSERLRARVKICHFIENPSPMSKDPDQLPRDRTLCNHSHSTDQILQFPAMTCVLYFILAFYALLLNPLLTELLKLTRFLQREIHTLSKRCDLVLHLGFSMHICQLGGTSKDR